MEKIGFNIRKFRVQKGFSQDYMANRLEISQASYARIENEDTKLTIERLLKIADILQTNIAEFFYGSKLTAQTQAGDEGAHGNGYIQNLHNENKEIYERLVQAKQEEIDLLKKLVNKNK